MRETKRERERERERERSNDTDTDTLGTLRQEEIYGWGPKPFSL